MEENDIEVITDFLMDVRKGYGKSWSGCLILKYQNTNKILKEKLNRLMEVIKPDARFNKAENKWTWPDGETLTLLSVRNKKDYWKVHGHQYPWIGFIGYDVDEELIDIFTNCNRSLDTKIQKRVCFSK